jgi:hypothetical protein
MRSWLPPVCKIFQVLYPPAIKRAAPLLHGPAACDQINHGNNQSDHEQQMDQATSYMESPAQEPQDDEDCEDCPKHSYPLKSEDLHRTVTSGERQLLRAELSLRQVNLNEMRQPHRGQI